MSRTVSEVLNYPIAELDDLISSLKQNQLVHENTANRLRDDTHRLLDGQEGECIRAARDVTEDTTRSMWAVSDALEHQCSVLTEFVAEIASARSTLRDACTAAVAGGCAVDDHGTVTQPPSPDSSTSPHTVMPANTFILTLALVDDAEERAARELLALDSDLSFTLKSENWDPTSTSIAVFNEWFLDKYGHHYDPFRTDTKFGNFSAKPQASLAGAAPALSFLVGVALAPKGEPLYQTLIAESAGVVGGVLGGRGGGAFGGAMGAPGGPPGVVAGVSAGTVTGGALGSFGAAGLMREGFDYLERK